MCTNLNFYIPTSKNDFETSRFKVLIRVLGNIFLINVIENGCSISHPIATNKVDLEKEFLESSEEE